MEQLRNWRWDCCLGQGGFGSVFKVWEQEAGRHYAVKLVPLSPTRRRDENIQGEVRALAGLSEVDGVVNYHHSWILDFEAEEEFNKFKQQLQQQSNGSVHFSDCLSSCSSGAPAAAVSSLLIIKMDYFEGQNLKEWLSSLRDPQGPLGNDSSETLPWLRGEILLLFHRMASVLLEIHAKNVVHRDLKPQNILVNSSGKVAFCDFGLSKCVWDSVAGASVASACGTPDYHAPEVSKDGHSKESDIYALGLIFLEMLTIYGGATESEKNEIFSCHKGGAVHSKMQQFGPETELIKYMLAENPAVRCSLKGVISYMDKRVFSRSYPCNICGTKAKGLRDFEQHMKDREHIKTVEQYRKGELLVAAQDRSNAGGDATKRKPQAPTVRMPADHTKTDTSAAVGRFDDAARLQSENNILLAENEKLGAENNILLAENEKLRAENKRLHVLLYEKYLTMHHNGSLPLLNRDSSDLE